MKTPENSSPEEDPSWDLLQHASKQTADPMFAKNIMRSIRLEDAEQSPWWKSLLTPRLSIAALTAISCIAILAITLNPTTKQSNPIADSTTPTPTQTEQPAIDDVAISYDTPETLDEIIDPLMLISYVDESDAYSLDELGL